MKFVVKWIFIVVDFLLFSNIYIAFATAALAIETIILFDISDFGFIFFIFFSTLFLYSFHRSFRLNKRSEAEQLENRHVWIKKNPILFYLIFSIAFLALCYSAFFYLDLRTILFLLPVSALSFGYSIPFIKVSNRFLRLRDLPGLKIFLISFTLSYVTVILPLVHYYEYIEISYKLILFVFFRRVLFVFAITIPFDIRDIKYDEENNVKTLPILYGVETAKRIAVFALLAFILLLWIQYLFKIDSNFLYEVSLSVSAMVSIVLILKTTIHRRDYFYTICLEGMFLLQALLVYLSSYFQ